MSIEIRTEDLGLLCRLAGKDAMKFPQDVRKRLLDAGLIVVASEEYNFLPESKLDPYCQITLEGAYHVWKSLEVETDKVSIKSFKGLPPFYTPENIGN